MALADSIFNAVESIDAQYRAMADRIARLAASLSVATVDKADISALGRRIDDVVAVYHGRRWNNSETSIVYRVIERNERLAAEREYIERTEDFRTYLRTFDDDRVPQIERALAGKSDPFARAYVDLQSATTRIERASRAGLLDPNRRWVDADGYSLSDRVWRTGARVRAGIDRQISRAVANGVGPETLARDLRFYLSPDYSPVRYSRNGSITRIAGVQRGGGAGASSARRLARTEMQAIAHETTVLFVEDLPITRRGVKWNLSPSHPKLDICDSYARNSSIGYPRGVYVPGSAPKIPHPNCICFLTPYVGTRQQVLDDLMEYAYA